MSVIIYIKTEKMWGKLHKIYEMFYIFFKLCKWRKVWKALKDKPIDYRRPIARLFEQCSKHNTWTFRTKLVE